MNRPILAANDTRDSDFAQGATLRSVPALVEAGLASVENVRDLEAVAQRYAVAVTGDMAKLIDSADPENYVELRGRVSMTPDIGRRVDTWLSWKYDGQEPREDRPGAVRVVVRMVVEKATGYAA